MNWKNSRFAGVLVALSVGTMPALATDVNKHLVFDWTPQTPATAGAALQKADFYDRIYGNEPAKICQMTEDETLSDGTVCKADPICIVTDGAVTFTTRRTDKVVPYVHIPQPEYVDQSGTRTYANQKINFPAECVKPVTEATVFMRMRYSGRTTGSGRSDIFMYGYDWSENLGFYVSISSDGHPALAVGGTNPTEIGSTWIGNEWMEIAWTVKMVPQDDGTTNCVACAYVSRLDKSDGAYQKIVSSTVTLPKKVLRFHSTPSKRVCFLSGQEQSARSASANKRHFKGDVQRLAVYDKAFTEDEIYQIMADDSSDFSVGVPNGSSAEFFDADAVADFDTATQPWRKFKANLTQANPRATLRVNLPSATVGNARLLNFGVVGDANRKDYDFLRVLVNGKRVGYVKIGPTNGTYTVCLPAALMKAKVVQVGDIYPLALTLERCGDWSGDMPLDSVTLGGTWQVGTFDYKNAEFGANKEKHYEYCLTANNPTLCADSMMYYSYSSAYNNLSLHFTVTQEQAETFETTLGLRMLEGVRWKITLNGSDYFTDYVDENATRDGYYDIKIPAGTLRPGQNTVTIVLPSTATQWTKPDAFKLTLTEQYPCSLYTKPVNLSGLAILLK